MLIPADAAHAAPARRLLVAITGASGAVYGLRLLQCLAATPGIETHAVVSDAGWLTLRHELDLGLDDLRPLMHTLHDAAHIGAAPASGSFRCAAMVVAPCSMRTLAAIAHGFCDNLITRAADVCLKERRKLVLLPREAPLNLAHLRNMTAVTEMGGIIFPPLPAFYLRPSSIEAMVDASLARVLDQFGIGHDLGVEWAGIKST